MKTFIKLKTMLIVIIVTEMSSGFVHAQTELSLKDALTFALENKADAVKAKLEMENADYKIADVRSAVYPQINAQVGVTYNVKLQQMALDFGGVTSVIRMGSPWQSNAVVQLDQQLFNMSVFQGLRATRTTREFYMLNSELTEEQIIEKVAGSYYSVFKTKSQIETIEKTIRNTQRIHDAIASLESSGIARKVDSDRIKVTLNNLNSAKIQLDNALRLQENSLKYLIGMDISEEISLPDNSFEVSPEDFVQNGFDINRRTEIQLFEKQGTLLKLNKLSISALHYPSVGLSANYGYASMGERFPYFAGDNPNVHGSSFSSVSLSLRVPIFSGFGTHSKVQQAQIAIKSFEADFKDLKLAMNLASENATTQIKNAIITLSSQKSNQELAKQVLENIEHNYTNGLASLTDLMNAESSYADAQNNYTAALLDYKLAEIQLKKANGELKSYYIQSEKL